MSSESNNETELAEAEASTGPAEASDTRQYVTFMCGDEVFAVEMAPVQEIIRVPEVVRVPLSRPRWKAWPICAARCCPSSRCGGPWALTSASPMTPRAPW